MNLVDSSINRSNRLIWIVMAGALLVRVLYLYLYQTLPDWDQLTVDNYYHHHWAQSIASGNILGDTTYFRAPLYIYLLSALYSLFGVSLWVGRILGLFIGLMTVYMTYRLGDRLFNPTVGVCAAAVYALIPTTLYFEAELLLDPLFTLLCLVAIYKYLGWLSNRLPYELFITGILFGMAAITRPTILIFIPIIYWYSLTTSSKGKFWNSIAMLTLGLVIVIGPVFARNVIIADDPVLIASQGGINFYIGNNETADGITAAMPAPLGNNWRLEDTQYLAEKESNRSLSPGEQSSFWFAKGVDWITNNPSKFTILYLKKLYLFFSPEEFSNNRSIPVFFSKIWLLRYNRLGFGLILPFAILGLIWASKKRVELQLVIWFIILLSFATTLFFISSRFRLPIMPFLTIFAVSGSFEIIRRARHGTKQLMPAMLVVTLIALVLNFSLVKLPNHISTQDLSAKGLKHIYLQEYHKALDYLYAALRINNKYPTTNLNIGICYYKLGVADSARFYFEQEKLHHPDRPKSYINLASLFLVNNQFQKTLQEINSAIALKPYDHTAQMIKLRALGRDELTIDSLYQTTLSAAHSTKNDIYVLNEILRQYMARNEFEIAVEFVTAIGRPIRPPIETDHTAFDANWKYSNSLFKKQLGEWHFNLGFIYGNNGKLEKSIRHSRLAITYNTSHLRAYQNLITGLESKGKFIEADSIQLLLNKQTQKLQSQ